MERHHQVKSDPRRGLPSVEQLARAAAGAAPSWALVAAAQAVIAEERERIRKFVAGDRTETGDLVGRTRLRAAALAAPHPRPVVNATGVVLHTNLGRAPLAPEAAAAAATAGAAYADLELDLDSGERGDRQAAIAGKLARLGGAEAALVVNNNAAAVVLALNTLALGREVLVSRGELVEIGGSFRVPEIMERAGVSLVEVGATNRTHASDYERAVGPETALVLKVHRSNFELRGFVAEVGLPDLASLARARGLPLLEDLGSGTFVELPGLPAETFVPARLRQGADLVCFSGDKLLGGPQAGIVLGRADLIRAMRRNPLARALRLDKLSLAALDRTLDAYLSGDAEGEIPVLRQLREPPERLEAHARRLAERLEKCVGDGVRVGAQPERGAVGGGSVPGLELPSWSVVLEAPGGAERLAARLREAPVPVVARIRDSCVLLDVRTLLDGEDAAVERAVVFALGPAVR